MKVITKLKGLLVLLMLGWTCAAYAAYSTAPTISTSGSATYASIAATINSWKNAWTPPANASSTTSAFAHRSAIIDQVEATIVAAGKGTITDDEYDVLADALYYWLHQVASEGRMPSEGGVYNNNRAGWYISGIGIPEWFFGKYANGSDFNNSQCVWELRNTSCQIAGTGDNGYGPMLGSNTRLVLFTDQSNCTIYRNTDKCNVMFSTNGKNSKLLILGRKNHTITVDGGKNFAEPTSYSDVLNRVEQHTSTTGNEVVVNGGNLLTAYTIFQNNVATEAYCKYREYTTNPYAFDENNAQVGGTVIGPTSPIDISQGGAISIRGTLGHVALYQTQIKNNAINDAHIGKFGGGISVRYIDTIADGIYMNKCSIKGNCTRGHGGGLSGYFDGGNSSEKMIIRNTEFAYNCQTGDDERHGGGIFYRDTGRQTELYNCTFTNNYAHGATAGGAGISTEGHLLLKGCSFDRNYSDNAFGGAIYTRPVLDGTQSMKVVNLKIDGCSFTNNQCVWTHDNESETINFQSSNLERGSGGAIMVDIYHGSGDIETTIYDVTVDIYGNSIFTNNTADRNGGAIAVVMMGETCCWVPSHIDQVTSNLKITSATINGNHVTNKTVPAFTYTSASGQSVTSETKNGGAIYLSHTTLTMDGGTMGSQNNPNYAVKGGGAYINDANLYMNGGNLCYNNASTNGGGVYLINGNLTMSGGGINGNTATNNGGGGYVDNGGSVLMDGGEIYDNVAINGAGLYVNGGFLQLESGYVHGNNASTYGGGVFMNGGNFYHVSGEVGKSYDNPNTAVNGAGVYMNGGNYTMWGGYINGNKASANGGGVYMNTGDFIMKGGTIGYGSTTFRNMKGGTFSMKNGYLRGNYASNNGGGVYSMGGTCDVTGGYVGYNTNYHNEAVNGGGIYSAGGVVTIDNDSTAVHVNYNKATNGGGIYTTSDGAITIEKTVASRDVVITGNQATNNGGGVFAGGLITIRGGNVSKNNSAACGGGVFVNGGTFNFYNGVIGGTSTDGNYTTGNQSKGGGIFMNGGHANIEGGSISGNYTDAAGMGGGVYMASGQCNLLNGATIGGTTDAYGNSAYQGGGIYSNGGTITVKGGKLQRNTATLAGGGIYTNGAEGVVNMEKQTSKAEALSYIEYNSAPEGGGIYANRGVVNFSDGYIQYNSASEAGGGIYVNGSDTDENDYGKLYLRGSANLYRNHVPTGKKGGGVYLKGVVQIGEQLSDPSLLGTIRVQENYAGDSYEYYSPTGDTINNLTLNTRNNIYLPDPDTVHSNNLTRPHRDVITLVKSGIDIEKTRVGFSVPHGNVPVIYCDYSEAGTPTASDPSSRDYLHQFSTGRANQYAVFDDTRRYIAVQYSDQPELFDPDHVYLYGFWSNVVTGNTDDEYCYVNPATFDPMHIGTPCELAFFISYVNGLNNQTAHPTADGRLVADIDMGDFGWVPIGHLTQGYRGHFDGNGHTVSGIVSLLNTEYIDYGFFGNLNGGSVENLFIQNARYSIEKRDDNKQVYIGGIAGHSTEGTIENCEVQSVMYAEDARTIMGGVIGEMAYGMVHSVCAVPTMTGNQMGGLVGGLVKGTLQNSFVNVKLTCEDDEHYYSGGLVGECSSGSLVENCYVRLREVTGQTGKFGVFVGDNTGGAIRFCYAPEGYTDYMAHGNAPTGHGNYASSELPYLYRHRDTQVTLASGESNKYVPAGADSDKQMMEVLNRWVDTINAKQSAIDYTRWGRPWQESDLLKFVNDDYPSLRMPVANAVGGKEGDPYLYYGDVDDLLSLYTGADESIWLYRTPADTVRGENGTSGAKLYIAEDVALLNENALKAYVGITLDNSAGDAGADPTYGYYIGVMTDTTDWHMISTPLSDAPLGIDYTDSDAHGYTVGHPSDMPYYRFYQKGDERNGYFPGYRYGTSYPASDLSLEGYPGNYYSEWDFYCYYEPEYHWINFKRNSASHHHFDTDTHGTIDYTNQVRLVPGKGYFAATREETFLQCRGTLNNAAVTYGLTKTDGVPRHGYNLLGNPYQAYLDFDKFAEANAGGSGAIWSRPSVAGYTIIDEDNPQVFAGHDHQDSLVFYRTYAYGSSDNEGVNPGRFLHPHQGFFVLLEGNATATAKFNPDQRNASDTVSASFRGAEHLNYPLVNLFAVEANGKADVVTVELGRPEAGGAPLMSGMRMGNGKIWCHYEDADYAVAFTQPGLTEANIRFETVEDTEYTMRWNTRNGDFSYLHLIDNMTGADVNCLTTDEYRFSARTSDYKSRFRLVFGYTGLEENQDYGDSPSIENFAFMMGDGLVVTGEGSLQVFDLNGRMLLSRELRDVQTTIQLPEVANGVYMLRLTDGKQSRVQKMVISK